MGDLEHPPEVPFQAQHPPLDGERQNPDAPAFPDVIPARLWDAGVSDASDDEPHPEPFPALKPDGSHMALRRVHRIPVDEDVQKSAYRAAYRPRSELRQRVPCKWVADRSAA
jgi:hypothetical protein